MAKFILIDHSLSHVGGHHFDYALQVLQAAEAAGYDIVLATNLRFGGHAIVPPRWKVLPCFRYNAYTRFAAFLGNEYRWSRLKQTRAKPLLRRAFDACSERAARLTERLGIGGRRSRVRHFADQCAYLFREVPLAHDDQVFLPTVSEFDVEGLVQFFESDPATQRVPWHLQFHFSILDGREPDYDAQCDRLAAMRRFFRRQLDRVPDHRLYFYNTSDPLVRQYDRLGVGRFENLTYPVNRSFLPRETAGVRGEGPLRVSCAGALRREKGFDFLVRVVDGLWEDFFRPGKMQLRVQSNKKWFRIPLPAAANGGDKCLAAGKEPIAYLEHPLDVPQYIDFISGADIGLMVYDPDRYYVRRGGVLGEFLSAGVPVIVPAGCWLADQITEPICAHVDQVADHLDGCGRLREVVIEWQRPVDARHGAVTIRGPRRAAAALANVPRGAAEVVVRYDWFPAGGQGSYIRLDVEQLASDGTLLDSAASVLGRRQEGRLGAIFPLQPGATQLRLSWYNAFHNHPLIIGDVQVAFHVSEVSQPDHPSGAVGLIAAGPGDFARLLREMATHYAHYRQTAHQFSAAWRQRHDATGTLRQLLQRASADAPRQRLTAPAA